MSASACNHTHCYQSDVLTQLLLLLQQPSGAITSADVALSTAAQVSEEKTTSAETKADTANAPKESSDAPKESSETAKPAADAAEAAKPAADAAEPAADAAEAAKPTEAAKPAAETSPEVSFVIMCVHHVCSCRSARLVLPVSHF